ncbi:MAG: hypothetical protein HUU20_15335 [Pirellulales bacterium]|nr:hypothetical protein [Pirellulales bacterium]
MSGELGTGVRRLPEETAPATSGVAAEVALASPVAPVKPQAARASDPAVRDALFARLDDYRLALQWDQLSTGRKGQDRASKADEAVELWWARYGQE